MADARDLKRLRALEKRIETLKAAQDPPPAREDHHRMANAAWRMVIELVSGLGIGFGIGYGLDTLFGTRPWLLVLFTLLGFAAGVSTMLRTARELQERNEQAAQAAAERGNDARG